jgi:hypothetical protein
MKWFSLRVGCIYTDSREASFVDEVHHFNTAELHWRFLDVLFLSPTPMHTHSQEYIKMSQKLVLCYLSVTSFALGRVSK